MVTIVEIHVVGGLTREQPVDTGGHRIKSTYKYSDPDSGGGPGIRTGDSYAATVTGVDHQ